jgi:hypothetical protein
MIFSNGTKEYIYQDALALDTKSTPELLDETRSFKIEPFSPFMNHICLGYEQMLKVGTNLEVKLGYIYGGLNTNFRSNYYSSSNYYRITPVYGIGGYVKGGVKFLLGQDFVMRGVKYAHPLKGRFVRFDVDVVSVKYNGVSRYNYSPTGPGTYVTTDITTSSYGLFLSYGRQWVLGDILTLDYYIGLGAAGQHTNYSNGSYTNGGYYYRETNTYYYAHTMLGATLAGTFGLSVGYIAKGPNKTMLKHKNTPATH